MKFSALRKNLNQNKIKAMSYKQKIKEHLVRHQYLNLFQAIELGTSRPAEYVRQLRKEGWHIETEWRSAGKKRYGVYRLDGIPQENINSQQNA
jgi:hypothetical protein